MKVPQSIPVSLVYYLRGPPSGEYVHFRQHSGRGFTAHKLGYVRTCIVNGMSRERCCINTRKTHFDSPLFPSLEHFSLTFSSLTGSIPSSYGDLTLLTDLGLDGRATGTIPTELGRLTNLGKSQRCLSVFCCFIITRRQTLTGI